MEAMLVTRVDDAIARRGGVVSVLVVSLAGG